MKSFLFLAISDFQYFFQKDASLKTKIEKKQALIKIWSEKNGSEMAKSKILKQGVISQIQNSFEFLEKNREVFFESRIRI